MAGWSLLPKDLMERISGGFESYFEIVHFRSVCSSWRSALPPPSNFHRLGFNSLLPIFNDNPRFEGDKHCILKKIPFFLLRYQTPFDADYLLVGMSESKSGKQKLLTLFQDLGLTRKYGIVLNTLSSQIIPLGDYYEIKFYATTTRRSRTRRQSCSERVAFLQMDKDFVVIAGVLGDLMMYRSSDKKWTEIEGEFESYQDMISYKGKFYVVDMSGRGHVFVIEPSSLEISEIHAITESHECSEERLVVSGDELLLVRRFTPGAYGHEYKYTWFRLFRLQQEGQRRWVRINDLEDRVIFLGFGWNLCYSAKELPGMKGNCVLFVLPNNVFDGILFFDLGTKRASNAFGEILESPLLCGILSRCQIQESASMTHQVNLN